MASTNSARPRTRVSSSQWLQAGRRASSEPPWRISPSCIGPLRTDKAAEYSKTGRIGTPPFGRRSPVSLYHREKRTAQLASVSTRVRVDLSHDSAPKVPDSPFPPRAEGFWGCGGEVLRPLFVGENDEGQKDQRAINQHLQTSI